MKSSILSFLLIIWTVFATAQSKDLANFEGLRTSGNVSVTLVKGASPKVDYTIIKGSAGDLTVEVKDLILTIKVKGNNGGYSSPTKAKVTVYYQNLKSIVASAGSSLSTQGMLKTDKLDLQVSSGATSKLSINANSIVMSASSGSSLSLDGSSTNIKATASSGASLSAGALKGSNVEASSSSGATLSVFASEKIIANASSGGSISYRGNPKSKKIDSGNMSGGSVSGS